MQWRLVVTLIVLVVVVLFSLSNAAAVRFNFIIGSTEISLALVIILSALLGAILSAFAGLGRQVKLRRLINEKERNIRELENRLEESDKKISGDQIDS